MRTLALAMLLLAASVVADTVVYNFNSTNATVMKIGDQLVVKLQALPGAGYTWSPTSGDRPGLKFVSSKMMPLKTAAIGGEQTQVLTFAATQPGEQILTLQYGRSWEIAKGAKPEKSLSAKIQVK